LKINKSRIELTGEKTPMDLQSELKAESDRRKTESSVQHLYVLLAGTFCGGKDKNRLTLMDELHPDISSIN